MMLYGAFTFFNNIQIKTSNRSARKETRQLYSTQDNSIQNGDNRWFNIFFIRIKWD